MIVLDTTVLVYAKGAEHPLRDPCRRLVEAVEDGKLVATTTTEVIQEFAHVRARRRHRTDATGLARDFAALFAPLLVIEEGHLHEGLELFEQLPDLGCFDAILAAAARSVRATALVSADRAFDDVPHLTHVVPDGAGVNALLAPAPDE